MKHSHLQNKHAGQRSEKLLKYLYKASQFATFVLAEVCGEAYRGLQGVQQQKPLIFLSEPLLSSWELILDQVCSKHPKAVPGQLQEQSISVIFLKIYEYSF